MGLTGLNDLANADISVLTIEMQSDAAVVMRLADHKIRTVDTFGDHNRRKKIGC